jgi:hypothetical protein
MASRSFPDVLKFPIRTSPGNAESRGSYAFHIRRT